MSASMLCVLRSGSCRRAWGGPRTDFCLFKKKQWNLSKRQQAEAVWVQMELPPPFEAGHYYWQPQTDWVQSSRQLFRVGGGAGDIFGDLVPQEDRRPVAFFVEFFQAECLWPYRFEPHPQNVVMLNGRGGAPRMDM